MGFGRRPAFDWHQCRASGHGKRCRTTVHGHGHRAPGCGHTVGQPPHCLAQRRPAESCTGPCPARLDPVRQPYGLGLRRKRLWRDEQRSEFTQL
jgi:hypothetical protein